MANYLGMRIIATMLFSMSMAGCAMGYNSVLMHTRTNFGVDIDSEPPMAEISIGRKEGTIQPVFEGGQTVPTLTSFRGATTTSTGLKLGAGSTFLGGEAAHVMARLYGEPTPEPAVDGKFPDLYAGQEVRLTKLPVMPENIPPILDDGRIRPLVFGTDTSIGLRVGTKAASPGVPSSIKFGFNRKELAFAPVAVRPVCDDDGVDGQCDTKYIADIPSFLATLETGSTVDPAKPASKEAEPGAAKTVVAPVTGLKHLQYFATGSAATNLAYRREVRNALIERTDPVVSMLETVEEFAASECSRKLIEWWRTVKSAGVEEERSAEIKAWLSERGSDVSVEELLYDPRYEAIRCEYVESLMR